MKHPEHCGSKQKLSDKSKVTEHLYVQALVTSLTEILQTANGQSVIVLHPRRPADTFCGTGCELGRRRGAERVSPRCRRLQPVRRGGGWPQVAAGRNWWC